MVRSNLGTGDRVLRFALAFWWLGPFAPMYASSWANVLTMVVGWIALVESFIGWCWLHDLLSVNNKK